MGRSVDMASRLLKLLDEETPNPTVALRYKTPLQLLVATILSAQCTDERVNQVTRGLFARYRTSEDYAKADPPVLEKEIRSTGFYKAKARNLIRCGQVLVSRFEGQVPRTMDDLITLPGVGRKTANVILGNCFGVPAVVVDTHVKRVAQRLGLADTDDPDKIEVALQRLLPNASWTRGSHQLLLHGRHICRARAPHCHECRLYALCPWEGKRPA
ncbi:MAG: endonuclease III [Nitrospiraceae bacterium]|nr:MAG: endonuclease III [Nitrospiraceae bacterium]